MTNQIPPAAPASGPHPTPSGEDTKAREDALAVSPAIGPLPPIHVPAGPGQRTGLGLLFQATARAAWAARAAGGWAARHRPHHRMRVRSSYDRDDH
jgi:hypothetical protein